MHGFTKGPGPTRGTALAAGLLAAAAADRLLVAAPSAAATPTRDKTITLVTHDSWAMKKSVMAAFEKKTGYRVRQVSNGDAGALTNKLVLTKDDPIGDVVYGIDNTFAESGRRRRDPCRAPGPDHLRHGALRAGQRQGGVRAHPDRLRRRVHQRRRHLVRRPRPRAAEDPRRPHRAGVQGTAGGARCHHLLARAGLPADHDRRQGRRHAAGRATGRSWSPTTSRSTPAGRTPTRPTSPPAAATAATRSCCPTPPRSRSPSPKGGTQADHQRAARHLLPPGGVRRGAQGQRAPGGGRRAGRLHALRSSSRRRCPSRCTSTRSAPARPLPTDWAKYAEVAQHPSRSPRPTIEKNRTTWLRQWRDLVTG